MQSITIFDSSKRYIFLPIFVKINNEKFYEFEAILDTGAPLTEFSDEALNLIGLLPAKNENIKLKPGFQTQKYNKVVIPEIQICSQTIENLPVYVSHFEKSWGIKALIGLDFFRQFEVVINYKLSQIITKPL